LPDFWPETWPGIRIAGLAGPSEIFVSSTVKDLIAGKTYVNDGVVDVVARPPRSEADVRGRGSRRTACTIAHR
jgi:hypothetical protein